jgi:hypothetical protein
MHAISGIAVFRFVNTELIDPTIIFVVSDENPTNIFFSISLSSRDLSNNSLR